MERVRSRPILPYLLALAAVIAIPSTAYFTVTTLTNQTETTVASTSTAVTTCPEQGTSCREDIAAFCSTEMTKLGLVRCLLAAPITVECRESLECRQSLNEAVVEACKNDKRKFCSTVQPSPGSEQLFACLRSHEGELETACQEALDAHEAAKPATVVSN